MKYNRRSFLQNLRKVTALPTLVIRQHSQVVEFISMPLRKNVSGQWLPQFTNLKSVRCNVPDNQSLLL